MDSLDASVRYQLLKIQTASTDELGLMLFETALRETKECQKAILAGDWTETFNHGKLAQDIMAHLAETVNIGHPHGKTMQALYLYCWKTIAFVQSSHVAEELDSVISVLQNLVEGLRGYIAKTKKPAHLGGNEEILSVNFSG